MQTADLNPNTLREQLAAIQHSIWAHWMTYLFSVSIENRDGSVTIPADEARRWMEQMHERYEELSEREKDSDREQADKVLKALGAGLSRARYCRPSRYNLMSSGCCSTLLPRLGCDQSSVGH